MGPLCRGGHRRGPGLHVLFLRQLAPLTNLAGIITSPFQSAYTAVSNWIADKQKYYEDYTALEEENAELKKQIAEMEEAVRRSEKLEEENRNYRDLLNLQQAHRDLTSDMESAYVIEHEVSNWTSSLTLNKGTASGVEVGDCVMDSTGAWWAWWTRPGTTGARY